MEQGTGWAKPAKYAAEPPNNGPWTEGDDRRGARAARAFCGPCPRTVWRPRESSGTQTARRAGDSALAGAEGAGPLGSTSSRAGGVRWRRTALLCTALRHRGRGVPRLDPLGATHWPASQGCPQELFFLFR